MAGREISVVGGSRRADLREVGPGLVSSALLRHSILPSSPDLCFCPNPQCGKPGGGDFGLERFDSAQRTLSLSGIHHRIESHCRETCDPFASANIGGHCLAVYGQILAAYGHFLAVCSQPLWAVRELAAYSHFLAVYSQNRCSLSCDALVHRCSTQTELQLPQDFRPRTTFDLVIHEPGHFRCRRS